MKRKPVLSVLSSFVAIFFGLSVLWTVVPVRTEKEGKTHAVWSVEQREKIPFGVVVDGVDVGGKKAEDAVSLLRKRAEENKPKFTVRTPTATFDFSDEISFWDDYFSFLTTAKKGKYPSRAHYFLSGAREKARRIGDGFCKEAKNAEVSFSSDGFVYYSARVGETFDEEKFLAETDEKLNAGERRVEIVLQTEKIYPKIGDGEIKKRTVKLSSFSTSYSTADKGRCNNIRRAAAYLDGLKIEPNGELSFNRAVGERTKERGFENAKIIEDGKFILGVGGGVCQVSTTLYNAALLAGLSVRSRNPHSLSVAYVPPSRDAMVSGISDLVIANPYAYPVYLSLKTGEGYVQATFFGRESGYTFKIVSEVKEEILPPEEEIILGKEDKILVAEKKGIVSEAYLEKYRFGLLVSRRRLSSDRYAAVRGKREVKGDK